MNMYGPRDEAENSIMQTISIAVSAILIAAGLITAPSLINNARDTNVRGDLANLAMAQEYRISDAGSYADTVTTLLAQRDVKTTIGDGLIGIQTNGSVYALFGTSKSGHTFWRSSDGTTTHTVPTPWPSTAPVAYPTVLSWPTSAENAATPIPFNMAPGGGDLSSGPGSLKTIWGASKAVDGGSQITPDGGSFDSFFGYTDQGEGMSLGMKAGHTYSFAGDIRVDSVSTYSDANWWRARSIAVFYRSGGNLIEARQEAQLVPNAVGTYHVSMTVSLPADTDEVFVRWYNGSPNPSDKVTWNNLMVNEGKPAPYTRLTR